MMIKRCNGCIQAEGSDSIYTCNCNVISTDEVRESLDKFQKHFFKPLKVKAESKLKDEIESTRRLLTKYNEFCTKYLYGSNRTNDVLDVLVDEFIKDISINKHNN